MRADYQQIKDSYFDALADIVVARQAKKSADSLGERRNWDMELDKGRAKLQRLYRQYAELEGYPLAGGLLKKAFEESQTLPYMAGWLVQSDLPCAMHD